MGFHLMGLISLFGLQISCVISINFKAANSGLIIFLMIGV